MKLRTSITGGLMLALVLSAPAGRAAYPGENGLVAFSRYDNLTDTSEIVVVDPQGGQTTTLTSDGTYKGWPVWSPNGKRLLFESYMYKNNDYRVEMIRADGKQRRVVVNSLGADFEPTWAPDGRRIAYISDRGGRYAVYIKRLPDGRPRRVTPRDFDAFEPDWSPTGRWISFYSNSLGNDWEVYKIRPDGSDLTALTRNDAHDYDGSWSPDGKLFAFTSDRNSPGAGQCAHILPYAAGYRTDCQGDVFVMRASGKEQIQLTSGLEWDYWPTFSPDGKKIAFTSEASDSSDIVVMDLDGSNRQVLTPLPGAWDYVPDWQPVVNR